MLWLILCHGHCLQLIWGKTCPKGLHSVSYTLCLSNIIAENYHGTPKQLGIPNLQDILINIVAQFVEKREVILEKTFSCQNTEPFFNMIPTVYPKKYAHGFVVLCFVVVMQSFLINSYEVFIHIHQGCFAGTGAIVRLPQCQWSKPDGYGKISQCITTTKHSKAKTVCIFLGIYCISV